MDTPKVINQLLHLHAAVPATAAAREKVPRHHRVQLLNHYRLLCGVAEEVSAWITMVLVRYCLPLTFHKSTLNFTQ